MKIKTGIWVCWFMLDFLAGIPVQGQISPGELSKVHSHLEGISNCTQCHILGQKVSNEKCLACHTELKTRVDQEKGFHSSIEVKGKECVVCHNDHHGINFKIVRFDTTTFKHQLTGFELTGAHNKKNCADCHKAEFITDEKIKAKSFSYLGLKTECLTCHTDYHQKSLGANCTECHDSEKFKPASKFDHQKATFQLLGKHKQLDCAKCHKISTKNDKKFQQFKGVLATNCTNCHKDVHNNKFGQKCADCHNNESFKVTNSTNGFDHNKADFKLEGKHQQVTCKACHIGKLTQPLKFSRCTDCHKDYHRNQFAKSGVSPDCAECHTVQGFTEFSFTIEQHNASTSIFPLKGAHLATPCFSCHKKQEKWEFKEIGKKCVDCHIDIHKNKIKEKYYPEVNCEICHSSNSWNQVIFDHKKTLFELEGAHTKQNCRACHFNKEKTGHDNQKFEGLNTACTNCHKDVHQKQFEINAITDCKRCHNSESFKPAPKFDHNKTQFVLDGKHVNVACNKCHKLVNEQGESFVLYKIKEFKCENCHLR